MEVSDKSCPRNLRAANENRDNNSRRAKYKIQRLDKKVSQHVFEEHIYWISKVGAKEQEYMSTRAEKRIVDVSSWETMEIRQGHISDSFWMRLGISTLDRERDLGDDHDFFSGLYLRASWSIQMTCQGSDRRRQRSLRSSSTVLMRDILKAFKSRSADPSVSWQRWSLFCFLNVSYWKFSRHSLDLTLIE